MVSLILEVEIMFRLGLVIVLILVGCSTSVAIGDPAALKAQQICLELNGWAMEFLPLPAAETRASVWEALEADDTVMKCESMGYPWAETFDDWQNNQRTLWPHGEPEPKPKPFVPSI
jgi:hypothetical protein